MREKTFNITPYTTMETSFSFHQVYPFNQVGVDTQENKYNAEFQTL